ncbi:MAG: radical SAM protein [Spirochaetales bacterium]|nr:radical SAM protein [Spirochaetales bacterium]
MEELDRLYDNCTLCPRLCRVDRRAGQRGFCGQTDSICLAAACLHKGEEPVLTGTRGSGTVFFSGCSLKCEFCQNYQISSLGLGNTISITELSLVFLALEEQGAANINIVSGSHFSPGIIQAIRLARTDGLTVPVVWNTSAYEEADTLNRLAPCVDIFLPDLKTLSRTISKEIFRAENYPEKAMAALELMAGNNGIDYDGGLMKKGMIVRHLVLPGAIESSREVLKYFKENLGDRALLSLMCQFIPIYRKEIPRLENRKLRQEEYEVVLAYLDEMGIEEGFFQEYSDSDAWIPDFNRENPFPPDYAKPVWHWRGGFTGGR